MGAAVGRSVLLRVEANDVVGVIAADHAALQRDRAIEVVDADAAVLAADRAAAGQRACQWVGGVDWPLELMPQQATVLSVAMAQL
jgi:hypothetical protein